MNHLHSPVNAAGRSYGEVPGYTPWRNRERSKCVTCGSTIVFIQGYEMRRDAWRRVPAASAQIRRDRVPDCELCLTAVVGVAMPPHDPSTRCESGGQPHCSCDTCY